MVGVVALSVGCRFQATRPFPVECQRPEYTERLRVLHVRAELGSSAGYPVRANAVVASAHQFSGRIRVAAVEGLPMMLGNLVPRVARGREDLPAHEDWVILVGTVERFTPNTIDPGAKPQRGARVLLGGFPMMYSDAAGPGEPRPVVIEGRVVETSPSDQRQEGLILVAVPEARYGGFSGGPAAVEDGDGELRVFGTIVYQGYYRSPDGATSYVLGVAPLPQEFSAWSLWKSY